MLSHEKVGIESEHAGAAWRSNMWFARQTASAVSALAVSLAVWASIATWTGPAAAETSINENEFGVEVTLPEKTIVYLTGTGTWDTAYETLVEALRTVHEYVDRRGLKPDGEAMMIYTGADDTGFEYKAAVPVMGPFENPPKGDLTVGPAPTGKAYKFVHRGAYDGMENLYEAITNFFDEKNIQPGELFIERYVTDPRTTPEDELVIEVIFPVK
jgi:effector-binding domain-containing protein